MRAARYRQLIEDTPVTELRRALQLTESHNPAAWEPSHWTFWDIAPTVALARLELLGGTSARKLDEMKLRVSGMYDWTTVVHAACFEAFDPILFERIAPEWRWGLACYAVAEVCFSWRLDLLPAHRWALGKIDTDWAAMPQHLRAQLAEALFHSGETARVVSLLAGDTSGTADALRAAVAVPEGRWAPAQTGFEAAFKKLQVEIGARKRLLPMTMAWLYPVALLAQQTPKHLETAKKFCAGEAGSRNRYPNGDWGLWVHAISARLGDTTLDPGAFTLAWLPGQYLAYSDLWRCLLRAWLGAEAVGQSSRADASGKRKAVIAALRERLRACGFNWLDAQLAAAEAVFAGGDAPEHFFVAGKEETWRGVLASLQALRMEAVAGTGTATRMVWSIRIDQQGGVDAIEPMEQRHGARGWSKPKALPLAKIARHEKLEPWDAKVVRAIRKDRHYASRYTLDRVAAIAALIGHPAVVMSDSLETTVDVLEGVPELEVVRNGERFTMCVTPEVRAEPELDPYR